MQTKPLSLPCRILTALWLLCCLAPYAIADHAELFDGKSLTGWETIEADQRWWSVQDGCIAGGSKNLDEAIPHNTFLSTTESFENFDLTLQVRLQGKSGFVNSGIQIRSVRVANSSEMSGYQVDIGKDWWGKLYDESRRNKVIAEVEDMSTVQSAIKVNDWNEMRVVAEGNRIRSWINGVPTFDYVEEDAAIPHDGHIGVQVHGGGVSLAEFKNIKIQRLPATKDAPRWPVK